MNKLTKMGNLQIINIWEIRRKKIQLLMWWSVKLVVMEWMSDMLKCVNYKWRKSKQLIDCVAYEFMNDYGGSACLFSSVHCFVLSNISTIIMLLD